jgi:glycosyltransferase involved in cell wall biosynthesis
MRVLYLNPFSQQVSGPDESLLTLLAALIPMGVEAHVVLPKPGPQVPRYEKLGVKVHFAPLSVLKRRFGLLDLVLFGPRLAIGVIAVSRIARLERIDLVHTNMEVVLDGAIASRLLRIPHVLHYRGNTLDRPKLVFDVLTRFWSRTAEKVFCISDAVADIFRKRSLSAKVEVLYNPVDLEAFIHTERAEAVRRELGAGPSDCLVGIVGRIHARKDIGTFLRAGALVAKQLAHLRLVVVGSAEADEELGYEQEMRKLSRDLGIDDRLCWAGIRRDVPRVLKALDVLVLSSRHEGFGRVVAEALAAGTPIVASREGAIPELLDQGAVGLLAGSAVPEDFAAAIARLLASAAVRREFAEAGQKRASAFAASAIAATVRSKYDDLRRAREVRVRSAS